LPTIDEYPAGAGAGHRTGLWQRIGSALYDPFAARGERLGMAERRQHMLSGAAGRVLEIGAGTGLNVAHYPDELEELVLSEPVKPMARRLERRLARCNRAAAVVRAPAEALPFPDRSFDTAVSTLTLCTVADPQQALDELARVLRPGGRLLFIEHIRSDDERLAERQDRRAGLWRRFALGCNCNRRTLETIEQSSFSLGPVERTHWDGAPRLLQPLAFGSAELVNDRSRESAVADERSSRPGSTAAPADE
jgi:ubiquinone/menaquinone biosynthesis C-methylase UbiE